jgi:hypothetical protein
MINYTCTVLESNPGRQRDGTAIATDNHINSIWTRFYLGQARSIPGYNCVNFGTEAIIRSMFSIPRNQTINVYLGRAASVGYITLPLDDNITVSSVFEIDRTPTGFISDPEFLWNFDMYTSFPAFANPQIVGQVSPNASSINNTTEGNIYYGDITTNTPLTQLFDTSMVGPDIPVTCSGGVVFIAPVLVAYGSNGQIKWNDPSASDPLHTWTHGDDHVPLTATIANTKIVYGTPVVGADVPTALFWSLNSLVRVSYIPVTDPTGTTTINQFVPTPVAQDTTIISANCVVSYKQTFFWIGTDNFYMYDGVCRPIKNEFNGRWFFDQVNLQYVNKIFGIVIPSFDEIWWSFTTKDSTENNWAIVYNVTGQFWYDTPLNRACGIQTNLFPKPLMADSKTTPITSRTGTKNNYLVWEHETGTDKTVATQSQPIVKSYSHHFIDICSKPNSQNRLLRNRRLEPDFLMTGNMTVSFTNLMYASDYTSGNAIIDGPYEFDSSTQYIDTASQGRYVSITFTSNELGGSFQGGSPLYDWEVGDVQT